MGLHLCPVEIYTQRGQRMSGPEPMPDRIYVTLIDAEAAKLLAEKQPGDLDTAYVRADLYEQAHQAETNAIRCMENACTDNERIKAQRDRYAEALGFYAYPEKDRRCAHWSTGYPGGLAYDDPSGDVMLDTGEIARAALDEVKE